MKKILILPIFFLVSCSSLVNVPIESIVDAGENVSQMVADSSVAKEAIANKTMRTYLKQYAKAYVASGTTISFKVEKLGEGNLAYLPIVTMREKLDMKAPSGVPSVHPIYGVVNNVLEKGLFYGFAYAGVKEIKDGILGLASGTKNAFYGDSQINGSFNVAGKNQKITTGTMQQAEKACLDCDSKEKNPEFDLQSCEENPPFGYINNLPMWSDGCSCGSHLNNEC